MPLTIPRLDDRTYNDILRETIARIPVHTPEWTNHNDSDPGITLLQLFAFMTENLLSQQPDRAEPSQVSHLLGVPMQKRRAGPRHRHDREQRGRSTSSRSRRRCRCPEAGSTHRRL